MNLRDRLSRFLLLSLLLLVHMGYDFAEAKPIAADQVVVVGKIYESYMQPLEYVSVAIFSYPDSTQIASTLTDGQGRFEFKGLGVGHYYITASLMGYREEVSPVFSVSRIGSGPIHINDIILEEKKRLLKEVAIVSDKPYLERGAGKIVLNVANSPQASNSIVDLLESVPGFAMSDGAISLRGKEGVALTIDGRSTYLSSKDLADLLGSMPASSVEKIEIIARPSASYDAAGSAGIINIKTKKSKGNGLNGSLSTGGIHGVYPKFNGGLDFNYKRNRYKADFSYGFAYRKGLVEYEGDKTVSNRIPSLRFQEYGEYLTWTDFNTLKAGFDYYIEKDRFFGVSLHSGLLYRKRNQNDRTDFSVEGTSEIDSVLNVDNTSSSGYGNHALNLSYNDKGGTNGRRVSINLDYVLFNSYNTGRFDNGFFDGNRQLKRKVEKLRNESPVQIDILSGKADYGFSFMSGNVGLGVKYVVIGTDSDIKFEKYKGDTWKIDKGRTNHFLYNEGMGGAYIDWQGEIRNFEVEIGARLENTHYKGELLTTGIRIEKSYLKLFPSFSISYALNDDHLFSAAYRRRIDRPSYQDLNPFIYYNTPYSYYQGNPFVLPQFTGSLETGYTYRDNYSLLIEYGRTKDYFTYVNYLDEGNATKETINNFDSNQFFYAELSGYHEINSFWSLIGSIDMVYDKYDSFFQNDTLHNRQMSFSGNLSSTFHLSNTLKLELRGIYRSPRIDVIKRIASRYRLDVSLKKNFWGKRGILRLGVMDVFYSYLNKGSNRFQDLNGDFLNRSENRKVSISLVYKFGKNYQEASKKQGSNQKERERIIK